MKLHKLLAMSVVVALGFGLVACGGTAEKQPKDSQADNSQKKLVVGMVTDVGGIHDKSFNQSAYEGLVKAKDENLIDIKVLESSVDSDYEKNISSLVDENVDVIVGVGYKLNAAIVKMANEYKNIKFIIVDDAGQVKKNPDDPNSELLPTPANVEGVLFKANETAFLGGYVAGLVTKTNKVGTVIGMDSPILNNFAVGYYAGVWTSNKDAEIYGQYSNSFSDVAKGKNIAEQLYTQGADVVYACAGNAGNGVIESAKERNKWVIGVDRDQYEEAPQNMLTSTMKRVDVALYNVVKSIAAGEAFGGKVSVFGIDTGAVGLSPSTQNLPEDVLKKAQEITEKMKKGEIKVPENIEQLEKMFPGSTAKFMK